MLTLGVTLAAGVGAVTRYLLDLVVQHRTNSAFPFGTLVVNLSGSLLLGVIVGLSIHHGLPTTPTVVIGAGFAGGYTTFSTLVWESLALGEAGAVAEAVINVLGSFAAGLAVAAAGLGLALL
jgi:CrcB protein